MSEGLNGLKEGLTDKERKVVFIPGVLEKFKNHIKQVFSDAELIENFDKEISFLKENKYIGKYFTFPDIDSLNYYVNVENDFRRKVFVNIGNVFLGIEMIVKIEEVISSSKKLEIDEPIDEALDKIFKFLSKKTKLPVNEDVIYLWHVYHQNRRIGKIRRLWQKAKDDGLVIDNIENKKTGNLNKESIKLDDGVYVIDNSFFNVISPFFDLVDIFMKLVKEYTGVDDDKLKLFFLLQKDYKGWIILDLFYKNYLKLDNKNKSLLLSFIYNWLDFVDFVNDIIDVYDVSKSKKEIPENIYLVEGEKILEFYKKFKVRIDDLEKEIALSKEVSEDDFRLLKRFFKSREDVEFFKEKGLFEKLLSFDEIQKRSFMEWFNSNKPFFKKHLDLIKQLDFLSLYKLFQLKNDKGLTDNQIILIVNKGLLDMFINELSHKKKLIEPLFERYPDNLAKEIFKLNYDLVEFIVKKNIEADFIENFIFRYPEADYNTITTNYEVYSYIKEVTPKIKLLPKHYPEKEKIMILYDKMKTFMGLYSGTQYEIDKLLGNLNTVISRISELVKLGYSVEIIESYYDVLLSKKTKKNGLKLSNVLDIIEYVLMNYEVSKVEEFFGLLSSKEIIISSDFIKNYESIVKIVIKNLSLVKEYVSNTKGKVYLSEIEKYLVSNEMYKLKEDLIINLFPEILHQEVKERENRQDFNDLIKIAKSFDLKSENEELVLELIILNNKKHFADFIDFLRFYIKPDIKEKFAEIFGLYKYLEESKKNIFDYLNQGFLKTLEQYDEDIKYWWLNEFVYGNLGPEFFFKEEDFEDEDNEKNENKGLSGLGGFTGKEVLRKLKKLGFEEKRVNGRIQGKGDHILLFREKDGKKQYFLVPMHRQVKASTLGDKLKMVGISKDEFLSV